ncbi:MAG: DUF1329 domain-containing protein [Pseudomonadota bacterium]|nr:DUF1329 domain-containing protein [Pseudomonadota bacterium]
MTNVIRKFALSAMALCALQAAGPSQAAATAEEIKSLGTTLTPMGAEKDGNKDGTIPPYSGKWLGVPPGVVFSGSGKIHPDPYPNEKPLFTITAQNMAQYAERLSDGEKAMFKRYPASFRMPVYPSHRDFRYPDKVLANVKDNAASAELSNGGLTLRGAFAGPAFPIPKSGIELLWDTQTVFRAHNEIAIYDQAVVYGDGNKAWGRTIYRMLATPNNLNMERKASLEQGLAAPSNYFLTTTLLPEREKGSINVGFETYDFANHPRQTWGYNPGTRRVRQAPEYGFDQPFGPGGFHTIDEDRLFNGSPERYDWKIVGKKEIYVPYHANKLDDAKVKYNDMLGRGHLNPDLMRYELHRVWVLEGKVKQGMRHLYAKRVMYVDEDTYNAVMADHYDARGELWRVAMVNLVYAYELQAYHVRVTVYHDLMSGAYMADRLTNEQPKAARINTGELKPADYTPDAARQSGL